MGDIADAGNAAFRDYVIDGVASSGPNEPDKPAIRAAFQTIENVTVHVTGDQTIAGVKTFTSAPQLPAPSGPNDAARKADIDAVASGVQWNTAGAKYATTAALPAYTYANGTAGVGATITFTSTGVYAPDGTNLALNDTLLVTGETGGNAPYNGKYKVTTAPAVGVAGVLTRAIDADSPAGLNYAAFAVSNGTANGGKGFGLSLPSASITIGTTPLLFGALPSAVTQEAVARAAADAAFQLIVDTMRYTIAATSQLPLMDAGGGLWWLSLVLDATGRILRGQKNDGSTWAAQGGSVLVQIVAPYAAPGTGPVTATVLGTSLRHLPLMDAGGGLWWTSLVLDATGRIVLGQKSDGSIWEATGGSQLAQLSAGSGTAATYNTDTNFTGPANPQRSGVYGTLTVADAGSGLVDMFIWLGQSYDQGANSAAFDASFTPSALDAGTVLMLNTGPQPSGGAATSFSNAYAQQQNGSIQAPGPLAGHMIQAAFSAAGITGPKTLIVAAIRGGTPYIGIKKGTPTYQLVLTYVAQALAIAKGNGQTLRVRAILTRHGEADMMATERDEFAVDWLNLRRDLNNDIKAITSQSQTVLLLTFQNPDGASTNFATDSQATLAQLDMTDLEPSSAALTLPGYWIGPQDNQGGANAGAHFMAMGWAQMDEAEGLAVVNHIYGPGFRPLRLCKGRYGAYWSSATTIELIYTQPVLLDTSNSIVDTTQLAAKGFEFDDGSGSPPTISGVAQVAASQSISISGSQITFGAGHDPQEAILLVYSGSTYAMKVDSTMTGTIIAAGFAALIGSATSSGAVLTLPGAPTSCVAYSSHLTLTLSGSPTGLNKTLRYAQRATGTGRPGNQTTGRGAVRSPVRRALSRVASGRAAFGSNPSASDTITCNSVAITFVSSGASGNQVNIGVNAAATALALYTFLAAQTANANLNIGRYTMSGDSLAVLFYAAASASYTLAKSSSAITVTAPSAIPHYEWAAVERVNL